MATNTKLNIYKAAKSIFDAAHEWKLIKDNPIDGVKRPSQSKKEKKTIRSRKQAYTTEEVAMLLTALYTMPRRWRLSRVVLGGFRRGEMLAVEWSDLDHDTAAIYVGKLRRRQAVYIPWWRRCYVLPKYTDHDLVAVFE
jgi:integrase